LRHKLVHGENEHRYPRTSFSRSLSEKNFAQATSFATRFHRAANFRLMGAATPSC
jgi:hypothetical protein